MLNCCTKNYIQQTSKNILYRAATTIAIESDLLIQRTAHSSAKTINIRSYCCATNYELSILLLRYGQVNTELSVEYYSSCCCTKLGNNESFHVSDEAINSSNIFRRARSPLRNIILGCFGFYMKTGFETTITAAVLLLLER